MRRFTGTIIIIVLLGIASVGIAPSGARALVEEPLKSTPTVATPEPQLDAMTAGGVAMIRAAEAMEAGAAILDAAIASGGDPALVEIARHWRADAEMLRDQGVWMIVSTTADSMVHDPDKAHELNLENLRANGEVMIAMGEAMVVHGEEMAREVTTLRDAGVLAQDIASQLVTAADDLVETGEKVRKDGREMRDYADRLLRSIGR